MLTIYVITALASLGLVNFYRKFAIRNQIVDIPNARSSHQKITARGGGIVFIGLWLCILVVMHEQGLVSRSLFLALYFPVSMVTLISCMDDALHVHMIYRLVVHIMASVLAIALLWPIDIRLMNHMLYHSSGLAVLLVLYLSWSVNAHNFLDGLDGLAAFHCIFICVITSIFLLQCHDVTLAKLHIFLAMAVLGFLIWNWPSAKIFMGDAGSASLGLLLPLMSMKAQQQPLIDSSLLCMLYFPVLFDTTITLLRRIFAGKPWYQAHRQHAFQRLHQCGWTHQSVLCGFVCLDIIVGVLTVASFYNPPWRTWLCVTEIILVGVVYGVIEYYSPMFK